MINDIEKKKYTYYNEFSRQDKDLPFSYIEIFAQKGIMCYNLGIEVSLWQMSY